MSTTTTDSTQKSLRYTDAQKKEVVDFVNGYNTANGRGGQSKAADKFKISQITIATWLKKSGAPAKAPVKAAQAPKAAPAAKAVQAPKAAKVAKAGKAAKAGKSGVGVRYTDAEKKEVVDFAVAYNAKHGRGGQSQASAKFKISPITVMAWLKKAGLKPNLGGATKSGKTAKVVKAGKATKAGKVAKAAKAGNTVALPPAVKVIKASATGNMSPKFRSLFGLSKKIAKTEADLASLQKRFNAIRASI
jgi:hypothetical protein